MLFPLHSHREWHSRQAHGPRKQAECISYIERAISIINSNGSQNTVPLHSIVDACHRQCSVAVSTIYRWWKHYQERGELPYESAIHDRKMRAKYNFLPKNSRMNDDDLAALKQILDQQPELYMDEVALALGLNIGKYFHPATIWRYATKKLMYSIQTLAEVAKQQSEVAREKFRYTLASLLQNDPSRLVLVDETHKDRSASRRRRGWGRINGGGVVSRQYYKNVVRYTLIAAADINGFIESACQTVD